MKYRVYAAIDIQELTGIGEEILLDSSGQLIRLRLFNGQIVRDMPNQGGNDNTISLIPEVDYKKVG